MKKILAATVACGLMASPVLALDAKIAAPTKTFEALAAHPPPPKISSHLCTPLPPPPHPPHAAHPDPLATALDEHAKKLGPEFETALDAGADLDPDSEDGKAYDASLDALDEKCGL